MTEPRTSPSEIMRREPLNARFTGVLADHVPDGLFRQTVAPSLPALVYPPKQPAGSQFGCLQPFIERSLDPARHRYCPGMASFAFQVNDGPVVFPLLQIGKIQTHRLVPSKATG